MKLDVYANYLELKEQAAQSLLEAYIFFIRKIEDNTLEANWYAQDFSKAIEDARKGEK